MSLGCASPASGIGLAMGWSADTGAIEIEDRMADRENAAEFTMDPAGLYREEVFSDRKAGAVRVLTPVTSEGAFDGK